MIPSAPRDPAPAADPATALPSRGRNQVARDALLAVVVWLIATPLAVLLVKALDLDPLTVAGAVLPVAVGTVAGVVVVSVALRRFVTGAVVGRVCAAGAGLYAAWVALVIADALHGTPFGYGSMLGDQGRLTAMATKYTLTSGSADAFVRGVPSEYPPLYPWLVGHVAQLVDVPAWRLMGHAQLVTFSGSVVVAFVLWRRLASAPVALAIAALGPAVFGNPSKDYELITLVVVVPWALGTFVPGTPRSGRLHWLAAGLIGGLVLLVYQGFLLYGALGILALIVVGWRASTARRRYVLHLVGVAAVAAALSAWYWFPLVRGLLTGGGERVSDLFLSPDIVGDPLVLPFLEPSLLGVVELIGLAGMVCYRKRTWWALPLLILLLGTYAYRVLWLFRIIYDGHTGFLHYTSYLIGLLLAAAGVLSIVEAAPAVRARFALGAARALPVAALAVLLAYTGVTGWQQWTPGPRGIKDAVEPVGKVNGATLAHAEPLPSGELPRYAAPKPKVAVLPVDQIHDVVTARLGEDARPVTLCYDQRLFAYLPWYGYTAVSRGSANTLVKWDDRHAELEKLADLHDPAAFARASAHTKYGPIDVFVLHENKSGQYVYTDLTFDADAFGGQWFEVVTGLPHHAVVAIRRH